MGLIPSPVTRAMSTTQPEHSSNPFTFEGDATKGYTKVLNATGNVHEVMGVHAAYNYARDTVDILRFEKRAKVIGIVLSVGQGEPTGFLVQAELSCGSGTSAYSTNRFNVPCVVGGMGSNTATLSGPFYVEPGDLVYCGYRLLGTVTFDIRWCVIYQYLEN